jgi:hypothetical protein
MCGREGEVRAVTLARQGGGLGYRITIPYPGYGIALAYIHVLIYTLGVE